MIRRLWASWGSQGAPQEIDEFGLMHRNDIESLIGEVFEGLPASVMEPIGDTKEPEGLPDVVPDVETPVPTNVAEAGWDPTDSEMLASTSDADLARLLGIRYQAPETPEAPTPTSDGSTLAPEAPSEDEQGYGLGRRWRYPLRHRPAPEGQPSDGPMDNPKE